MAALATIDTIEHDKLLARATAVGERFRKHFEALKAKCPLITEIRIMGTMIGLQLSVEGAPAVADCLKNGLLINCTHQTVIRLLPAITISDEQIDEGCTILGEALLTLAAPR
jgi:acetylornithine/succinyldiaminopimelate/putrescine aminotransferase